MAYIGTSSVVEANSGENVWVLILVAFIGAFAVLVAAWVANHGQLRRDRQETAQQTRIAAIEAASTSMDYLGQIKTLVSLSDRLLGAQSNPDGERSLDTLKKRMKDAAGVGTSEYALALRASAILAAAADIEVAKQGAALRHALIKMSDNLISSLQENEFARASSIVSANAPVIEREVNVLLFMVQSGSRLESTIAWGPYFFRSRSQANAYYDSLTKRT